MASTDGSLAFAVDIWSYGDNCTHDLVLLLVAQIQFESSNELFFVTSALRHFGHFEQLFELKTVVAYCVGRRRCESKYLGPLVAELAPKMAIPVNLRTCQQTLNMVTQD